MAKCGETRCALREKCQRFAVDGTHRPSLPFLAEGETNLENPEQQLQGCVDFWEAGTGTEYFEQSPIKTPTK